MLLGGVGLMVGILPGRLAAGAVVTWRRLGGDLREIGLLNYFRLPGAGRASPGRRR
jgi:type IV secretion system protein VirD4